MKHQFVTWTCENCIFYKLFADEKMRCSYYEEPMPPSHLNHRRGKAIEKGPEDICDAESVLAKRDFIVLGFKSKIVHT